MIQRLFAQRLCFAQCLCLARCLCLAQCLCLVWVGLAWSTVSLAAPAPITTVAFSPDGKAVVAGSQAGVRVFSWPDLQLAHSLTTQLVNIHDLKFSPDGKHLAVGGGEPAESGAVEILAWPSGESQTLLAGHTDSVLGVAWRSNAQLASASLDHEVVLWSLPDRGEVHRFRGHSRGVSSVCFLSDGDTMVTAGLDQNIRVWDIESRELKRTLNNHKREIHELAMRPAEGLPMVASVSRDRTMRLWQPTIGRMVRFAQLPGPPLSVTWLPDGSLVAVTVTDGNVYLIDPDTVEIVKTIAGDGTWAYALTSHPSEATLVAGDRQGRLRPLQNLNASP